MEPRKNISRGWTQDFQQGGHDISPLEILVFDFPQFLYKNYRKVQKLQDARKVLISPHFLTFETQSRFGMLQISPPYKNLVPRFGSLGKEIWVEIKTFVASGSF